MAILSDSSLLIDYAATGSHAAFTQLVSQNLNLVYASALRQTRDPHLADDVAQAVFLILARRPQSIRDPKALPAWLITTTRYCALNAMRLASRRQRHEQQA